METHLYDFHLRVLLYEEDGEWVAHALEMDLLGYGKTENAAVKDLQGLVEAQLSFARQKNDDTLLAFPAPKEFFDRWEIAHTAALKKQVFPDRSAKLEARAIFISLNTSLRNMEKISRRKFEPVTG